MTLSSAALLGILLLLFFIRKNSHLHLLLLAFSIPYETYAHWDIGFTLKPVHLFAITTFISMILNKEKVIPSLKSQLPFLLILLAAFISLINAPRNLIFNDFPGSIRTILNLGLLYFIAYVISISIKDVKALKGVMYAYAAAVFLSVIIETVRAHLGGWEDVAAVFAADMYQKRGGYMWLPSIVHPFGFLRLSPIIMPPTRYAAMLMIALTFITTLGIYNQVKLWKGFRYLLPVLFSVCLFGLTLTFARGSWISYLAALFIILFFLKKQELHKAVSYGGVCLIATTLLLLNIYPKNLDAVFERVAPMPVLSAVDASTAIRISAYKIAFESFKAHPIIGTGWASNLKPLNVFLQILCESGLMGLTAFMGFIFYIFFNLYKSIRKLHGEMKLLSIGITAGLIGTMIYFNTEVVLYEIQHWLIIGLGLFVIRFAGKKAAADC